MSDPNAIVGEVHVDVPAVVYEAARQYLAALSGGTTTDRAVRTLIRSWATAGLITLAQRAIDAMEVVAGEQADEAARRLADGSAFRELAARKAAEAIGKPGYTRVESQADLTRAGREALDNVVDGVLDRQREGKS